MARAGKEVSNSKSTSVDRANAAELRKDAPNPVWFKPLMFGFMLLGLIWIVLYYVTSGGAELPIPQLGQANIFVGFGLVLVGFMMTPWWK
ncbi:cell division protein CrgA [Leucobacter soli]|nr:cell division protein CrgA [Leucobacter soli]